MDEYLYGRYTTLNKLQSVRDDPTKAWWVRKQASESFDSIVEQFKDRKLNHMRERLIKATKAGDQHEAWKIENQIKNHLGEDIEVME